MSFEFTPTATGSGQVANLALAVSRGCRESSSEDFQKMADDVSSLYMALIDIRDSLTRDTTGLSHTRADSLKKDLNNCHTWLKILEQELHTYNRMPFASQRTFTALHCGLEDAGEAHDHIKSITTSLRNIENDMAL